MLTRESGHFGIELEFEDWRVPNETILADISRNDLRGVFTQFEDGGVAFTLSDPKGKVFSLRSQRVQIDNPGAVFLLASWTPAEKFICANGTKLLAADQTEDTAIIPASPSGSLQVTYLISGRFPFHCDG